MTLSASRLYIFGDKMINEYVAVNGMKIRRGRRSTRGENLPQCHFALFSNCYYDSQMKENEVDEK
jgi:hypothetical protein